MNYTDAQLQLALAKMLPEKIAHDEIYNRFHWYISKVGHVDWPPLRDTEWLHVCWLVEETLTPIQRDDYYYDGIRKGDKELDHSYCVSATWQQRAIALAKVKGIDL